MMENNKTTGTCMYFIDYFTICPDVDLVHLRVCTGASTVRVWGGQAEHRPMLVFQTRRVTGEK